MKKIHTWALRQSPKRTTSKLLRLFTAMMVFVAAVFLAGSSISQARSGHSPILPIVSQYVPIVHRPVDRIVFQMLDINTASYDIYSMNADGSQITRLTDHPKWDIQPRWSPDNSQIVFVSKRDDIFGDIYIMDQDGANVRRLTNNPAYDAYPDWSPDGSKIVFSSNRDGNEELYIMNVDGSETRRITNKENNDIQADWSPDGNKIVFFADMFIVDPVIPPGITIMNADGTGMEVILPNIFASSPMWSPDGSKIAMTDGSLVDAVESNQIVVYDVAAKTFEQLTAEPSDNSSPTWCSGGHKIVFMSMLDSNVEMYSMNADGSSPTRLTTNGSFESNPDCTH